MFDSYDELQEFSLYKELKEFTHHGKSIPEYMHGGIVRYVLYGLAPGDFLTSVITNDLFRAARYADGVNENLLVTYTAFFYNNTPGTCWGSVQKMNDWMRTKQEERNVN